MTGESSVSHETRVCNVFHRCEVFLKSVVHVLSDSPLSHAKVCRLSSACLIFVPSGAEYNE